MVKSQVESQIKVEFPSYKIPGVLLCVQTSY